MRSILAVCLAIAPLVVQSAELPRLSVSENGHFLKANDQPFFWLGDTAWELFHRLNREEAIAYLDHRAKHGFNVIQAVALAELDGLHTPNAYGHKPLIDDDPTKPDVKHGPDNDYWDHVDFIVDQANQRGIYIGFLPTWATSGIRNGARVLKSFHLPTRLSMALAWRALSRCRADLDCGRRSTSGERGT